jgi:2-dehydro-3-deoxyphosphogalactonate aldolase
MKSLLQQQTLPLIAILRGVTPDQIIQVSEILVNAGFTMIEVPLNSPDALTSIQRLVDYWQAKTKNSGLLLGAGTVTTMTQAQHVLSLGVNLVVMPHTNPKLIDYCVQHQCTTIPGVFTTTEAFTAIQAGASALKVFPISVLGVSGFAALRSVLPQETLCFPVGGINSSIDSMKPYLDNGAYGFGIGSALFSHNISDAELIKRANAFVACYRTLKAE